MHLKSFLALFAAALLIACAPLHQAPNPSPKLKEDVAGFLTDYLAAISSRDATKIRNSYVADDRFVWIEDGKERYRKVDDVLPRMEEMLFGGAHPAAVGADQRLPLTRHRIVNLADVDRAVLDIRRLHRLAPSAV